MRELGVGVAAAEELGELDVLVGLGDLDFLLGEVALGSLEGGLVSVEVCDEKATVLLAAATL